MVPHMDGRRGSVKRLLCGLLAALLLCAPARPAAPEAGERYIVKYKVPPDAAPVHTVNAWELEVLLRADALEWYEPDGEAALLEAEPSPWYGEEKWDLAMIGADAAFEAGFLGRGVRIGVLDSGVNPHPDLEGRLLPGRNTIEGADPDDTTDNYGHGTRVAGLIAGSGEAGAIGAAPEAELVPLKCTEGQVVPISAVCRAIYSGIDDYGCDILNLSMGVPQDYLSLREAIEYAEEKGVLVLSSVGNGGSASEHYPAAYETVVGVGTADASGQRAERSNYNESVFLLAPGQDVRSIYYLGGYRNCTGTSFAVPQAAAAASRAMAVTALWRLEGAEPEDAAPDYSDTAADAWYAPALVWASRNGIVNGDGDGRFRPNDPISRQELAAVLCRYAAWKGADVSGQTGLERFADGDALSPWAAAPVAWAVDSGLILGLEAEGQLRLSPGSRATRAQLAAMLARLMNVLSI